MESQKAECSDPRRREEIEMISIAEDIPELVDHYHTGEPSFLRDPRAHWSACAFCRDAYPDAMDRLAQIEEGVAERARQSIENLNVEYAAEFFSTPADTNDNRQYADRIAALASTYSAHLNWQLAFLLLEPSWTDFTVLQTTARSSKKRPIIACRQRLNTLSPEAIRFVFTAVLASELYLMLYEQF